MTRKRTAVRKAIARNQGPAMMIANGDQNSRQPRVAVSNVPKAGFDMGEFSQLSMMALNGQMLRRGLCHEGDTDRGEDSPGGVGYLKDYTVERLMRRRRSNQIWEGNNQIQAREDSRHVLGNGSLMSKLKSA